MYLKNRFKLFDELTGEGGEGSAAAAVPPQESAPVEDTSFEDTSVDWADLSGDVDSGVFDSLEEETPPGAAETPADAPAGEAPAVAPIEPPAAEQPPAQPVTEAPVAPQPQFTPEQVRIAEATYMAQLENLYRFDEDTTLKLQTEPEKVLPALAAKLHLDVMKTVMSQMQGVLPQMLQTQTVSVERENSAKTQFFGVWPELKGYEKQVLEVGKMYRQMNPNAPADEAIKRIGEVALTALGLQRAAPTASAPAPQPQGAFRPSVPGRVNPPARPASEWEELIDD